MDIIINDDVLSIGYELPKEGMFRRDLAIPANLNTSYKVFDYLLTKWKTGKRAREAIMKALEALRKKIEDREKVLKLPKVKRNISSSGGSRNKSKDKNKDKNKKQGLTREQLITTILYEQQLYGDNS